MATGANRDVTLGVGIKTTGQEALGNLAREVDRLARSGGDATPVYERLSAELRQLGEQAGSIENFKRLSEELDRVAAEQLQAAANVERLKGAYAELEQVSDRTTSSQQEARKALRDAQDALTGARLGLERYRAEATDAERKTATYTTEVRRMRVEVVDAREALAAARNAWREASEAAEQAAARQRNAGNDLQRAAQAAEALGQSLRATTTEVSEAAQAAERLGVSTDSLTESEQRLIATQQRLVAEANETAQAAQQAAAYIKFWEQAADELARAEREATTALERKAISQREAQEMGDRLVAQSRAQALAERELAEATTRANVERFEAIALADRMRVWEQIQRGIEEAERKANEERERTVRLLREAQAEADKLIAQERAQAEAQARIAAETTRANEERFKSIALAQRMSVWEQALERVEQAEIEAADAARDLALAAERAGEEVREAFGTAGVRSLQAIEAEVNKVNTAVDRLQVEFRQGAISADDLARATSSAQVRLAALKREAATVPALPGAFERISSGIDGVITRFGALGAAIATVAVAGKPILDTILALDQLERTLNTVLGSTAETARTIEFLRDTAQRSGQGFNELSQQYAKFVAAAKSSGIEMSVIDATLKSVALAAGNLGLNSEQSGRALNALAQSASKGVIQMEELRGQLGDALPGSLALLAKGLGLTDQQLIKLVESGNLLTRDALPALARALVELGPKGEAPVEGIRASWTRLTNTIQEATAIVSDGALGKAAGAIFEGVKKSAEVAAFAVVGVGEGFTVAGQLAAAAAGRLTGEVKDLGAETDRIFAESAARIDALSQRMKGAATSTEQAADAATSAWVKTQVALNEAVEAAAKDAVTAGKVAEAKKIEAEARGQVAAAAGEETKALQISAEASAEYAATLSLQADQDQRVADLVRQRLVALTEEAAATGRSDEATKKYLETQRQNAEAKQAEADKTREAAEQARAAAAALDLQARAARNNSGSIDQMRVALILANSELARVTLLANEGRASKERLAEAERKVATAAALLRDALSDENRAIEQGIRISQARFNLRIAEIRAKADEAEAAARVAAANGNETLALLKSNEAKAFAAQAAKLSAEAKKFEADETIRLLEKQLAELKGTDDITNAKRAELTERILNAQAKAAEAKGSAAVAAGLESERIAINARNAAAAARPSGGGGTTGTNGTGTQGTAGGGTFDSAGNYIPPVSGINAQGKVGDDGSNRDKNGRTPAELERLSKQGGPVDASYNFDIKARLDRGERFSAEEIPALLNAYRVAQSNQALGQPGSVTLEGRADDRQWVEVFRRALEQAQSGALGGSAPNTAAAFGSGVTRPTGPVYQTVVNLGGGRTTINTASQADQAALEALLRQLDELSRRVGGGGG